MKKHSKLISIFAVCLTFLLSFLLCNKTSVEVNAGNITYEEAEEVSISDLKYNDSLVGDYVTLEQNSVFSYEGTKEYGSIVFKFQYVVSTWEKDSDGMQIYFSNTWDTNGMIWIRPDHIYMAYMEDTKQKYEVGDSFEIGTHDIEVGRIASFNDGTLMGHKEYVKVDGELVGEHFYTDIPKTQYDKNNLFLTSKAGNTLCDTDYVFSDTETLDTSFDEFSISNLSIDGSKNKKTIHDRKDTNATYSKANKYGSFAFKFLYDVKDDSQVESNSFCIYFGVSSDIWNDTNGNSLIIRGDGIYFMVYENKEFTFKKVDALEKGFHEFEVGRIAYLKGFGQSGNYKVYLKIDGEEVVSSVNPYNAGTVDNRVFFHFGETNTLNNIYDIGCDPEKMSEAETYETPDTISVNELKFDGELVGSDVTLDTIRTYTYDSTAIHHSVVFNFTYQVIDPSSVSCQIIFGDGWNDYQEGGVIWLRYDKTFINNDSKWTDTSSILNNAGMYEIEVGKIYISGGLNDGCYHIYLKCNGTLVTECITGTDRDNNFIFLTGTNSDHIYDSEYEIDYTEKEDTTYDSVNLKDLTIGGSKGQITLNERQDTNATYSKNNTRGSLVFKFKYNVVDDNASENNSFCIYFGVTPTTWNDTSGNSLLIRGDGLYFLTYSEDTFSYTKTNALSKGVHEIEIGRIAIISNYTPTGKYKVYVKVDGVEVVSSSNPYSLSTITNEIFFHYGTLNTENNIYDLSVNPELIGEDETYETPDTISIRDLKYNGSKVGQKLTLVTNRSYSYDSKAQNTSVVLKFKYEVPSMPSKEDFSYFQLHFSNTWTEAGFIWIRNDLAVIRKDSDGYVMTREKLFDSVGTHDVEVGKIFVTGGVNYGKYYIYLKVDGELALEFTSSNVTASSGIFLVSNNGHTIYDANYGSQGECVLDENPDRVSVKDLGFNGLTNQIWIKNNEHTEVFYNKNSASGSLVFTFKYNIITQYSTDNSGFRINFDVADDIWDSSNALWLRGDHTFVGYASNLEQKWKQNAALTLGMHDIEFGRIAYLCEDNPTGVYYVYYKVDGELIFSIDCDYDSTKMDNKMFLVFGKEGKENKVYDATYDGKHIHNLEYYPYKDATCFEDGNVEYWGCVDCGSRYTDENGTQEIDFITIVKYHNVTKVEAVESTCFTSGNVEYYICTNCGKKFANEESTIELTDVIVPKSHRLEFVEAKEATENEPGNIAYYHCTVCCKDFLDAGGKNQVFDTITVYGHSLIFIEAIEATCTESGNIAYYYCQDCGKCYLDVYGREEVTVVFIKPQHQLMKINAMPATCIIDGNEEYWLCISCHKKFADEDATEEVTEISIKSNGHQFDENGVCTICGMNQDQNDMIYQLLSQFGCTSSISASGIILLAGIAAFILDRKKKFLV